MSGSGFTKMRKARLEHECSICGRTIEPGETYQFMKAVSFTDGFETFTDKWCWNCYLEVQHEQALIDKEHREFNYRDAKVASVDRWSPV